MKYKGKFIVLEGIDGCGKGTQAKELAMYLFGIDKKNHILITREPTNISLYGRKVRELLRKCRDPKQEAEYFTKLYVKDRWHHIKCAIEPALRYGSIVVCDRYKYSTISYQLAQGIELKKLLDLHKGMIKPDITFIIDVSVDEAIRRIYRTKDMKDVFEKKDFLELVRNNYLKMKDIFKRENIVIIDGMQTPQYVFYDIKRKIDHLLTVHSHERFV
jgi:dTMP kinase